MRKFLSIIQGNKVHIAIISILFLAVIFMVSYNIGKEQIKIWDESSAAKNAVEMLSNKNYFIAYNDGQPDHKDVKPPLQLWLKVISFKIFGINEFAVRFPSILSVIGIMLLLLMLSNNVNNKRISIGILYLMAITPGFMGYHVARHGDTDALLMFFVTGYFVSFFMLLEYYPKFRTKWLFLFGMFIVLATYTKSIAGLAPLAGFPIYFFLYKKNLALFKDYRLYTTILLTLIAILSYYIIREIVDPGFLKSVYRLHFLVIKEYPGRVKHPEFTFYLTYIKNIGFSPFLNWLPFTIIPLIWSKNPQTKRLLVFSLITALFFMLGQSALVMKNEWYIAPVYIFLWVAVAIATIETITIANSVLKHKILKTVLFSIAIIGFTYFYINRYVKVFNHNNKNDRSNIYAQEKEGHTLREIKPLHPEIKKINIASKYSYRQVKFYTKKYEYEDSSQFNFIRTIKSKHLNEFILASHPKYIKQLDSIFYYSIIEKAPYGALYYTDSLKAYK